MNGVFLDWAATSPIVRFPIDTSKQWRNPNAAYAYEERKVLMDCEERIKAAIGAKGGHVLYFRCATDALEWLSVATIAKNPGRWFAHSPYEHDAAVYGSMAMPDQCDCVDFYCHQLVNQLTGQIHDIKAVHEQLLQYDEVPFLICDCTAAIHHISLKAAKVCQYAACICMSGHKLGCPDIAFMWIDDRMFNWLGGGKDIRNQYSLKHGSISVGHVLALADAVEWACDSKRLNDEEKRHIRLFDCLYCGLKKADIDFSVIANMCPSTYAINAIRLNGLNADSLQQYCASKGIYISAGGSACNAAGDFRVLNAYGLSNAEAAEVIRVSFGDETTKDDINKLVSVIKEYKERFVV